MNTKEKGDIYEQKAAHFLTSKGFKIIERNFHTRLGEIDIIALKDKVLHFVEVKSGVGFEPIYNITPKKLQRIHKAIQQFLQHYKDYDYYCVDAIIIQNEKLEWLENIELAL